MQDDRHDNIFADDDALDFIIYEELEKQGQERKSGKGGCFGIVSTNAIANGECDASELEMK